MANNGRLTLVTGAAHGLGAAYAKRLAADGYRIAAVDILDAHDTVQAITQAGGEAQAFICDVAQPAAIDALFEQLAADMGTVDVLVNNAGIYTFTPHEQMTFETWRRIMSINLDGMLLLTQAALPGMKEKGWGRIINVASNSCFLAPPGLSAYVASKCASIGYVQSLSGEVGQYGITVNAVAPGPTVTKGTRADFPDEESFMQFMAGFLEQQAIKKISLPEYSASVVSFFASDEAHFVTGQVLVVDGGFAKH